MACGVGFCSRWHYNKMRDEMTTNQAYDEFFDEFKIQSKTFNKVPAYKPPEIKDTRSKNGYVNIFFNVCGIAFALATLPLGLYQEINVESHGKMNSIKLELYGISGPPIKLGLATEMYFWALIAQLFCLMMIAVLTSIQACTNIVL